MVSVSTLPADGRTRSRSPLLSAQLTSPRTRAPKWSPGDCLTTEASSSRRRPGSLRGAHRCTNRHVRVGASRHESLRADERIPPSTKLRSSGRAASRGGVQAASSPLAAGCPSPDDRRIDVDRLGSVGGWTPASDSRRFASSWLMRPCREVAVLKRTGRHQLGLRSVDLRTMATVRPPAPPCCVLCM